jgi:hypothetical protein
MEPRAGGGQPQRHPPSVIGGLLARDPACRHQPAARPEAQSRQFTVVAYDPGRTPGTGLLRNNGPVLHALWQVLGSPLLRPLVPRANSRKAAGGALAELALGRARPPAGRIYAALRRGDLTWRDPSELARRDDVMQALWRDSAALVGLGHEATNQRTIGTNPSPQAPQPQDPTPRR